MTDSTRMLALAVESAIFQCLQNAQSYPEDEDMWRRRADRFEQKFTTEFGQHYSYFIYEVTLGKTS